MSTALSLRNVSKSYSTGGRTFKALDGVDLDIEAGKLVVILGPSGAGKSTLLNLIGGMDTPTEGTIIADGTDISGYSENELADYRAANVGFIFQFYNILPTLTVLENVSLVADLTKDPLDAASALKAVGLEEHMNKFPNQLSGGEQQRVSIARAIAKNPSMLLCDEPTGALDSATGVTILKLLKEQTLRGKTVIIVTHNSLFADVADVVVRLKNGKIRSVSEVKDPKNIDEVEW
ncbi:MAG: ABC transporter ATP-binding protein [Lachnospiraceae bacterium]|nr:ABC transporter ATP-binding protein [Lachnospiraceae bacterium]